MEKAIATRAFLFVVFCASFGLLAAAGCTTDASPQPAPAPPPQPAPARQEPKAKPEDLKSLQEKLQPPAAPDRSAPALDEPALLSQAGETVKTWVKELDADNDREVRATCLNEADL